MPNQLHNTDPNVQAYLNALQQDLKGRFTVTAKSIRLYKDNPYIMDLPEIDRIEANKKLLVPYDGEIVVDDENYKYHCKKETNTLDGTISYKYYSKEKELEEVIKKYERTGILNQLMSAYNNGRIYKLFIDTYNGLIFSSNDVVYPKEYYSYTIRAQETTSDGRPIYVCGTLDSSNNLIVDMAMKKIIMPERGIEYMVMSPGKIIDGNPGPGSSITADQIQPIKNGKFYIVEFKDKNGLIIDTKLYQASNAAVSNTENPSSSVVSLAISVLRNNIQESNDLDIYPMLVGEDIQNSLSFIITAMYNDGTKKVISNLLGTNHLTVEGLNFDTSNVYVGQQFDVTFKYNPTLDNTGTPSSASITKKITLQVVSNLTDKLYKVIPVIWTSPNSSFSIENNSIVKNFHLKVFTLDKDGVLENRTKQAFDTLKYVNESSLTSELIKFDKFPYVFDGFNQCISFVVILTPSAEKTYTFSFKLYSESVENELRFKFTIAKSLSDTLLSYVNPLIVNGENYGYNLENGLLKNLKDTFTNNEITKKVDTNTFRIENKTAITLVNKYSRIQDGNKLTPTHCVLYAVSKQNFIPITEETPISSTATTLSLNILHDVVAKNIFESCSPNDYILTKFIYIDTLGVKKVVNIDVYKVKQ